MRGQVHDAYAAAVLLVLLSELSLVAQVLVARLVPLIYLLLHLFVGLDAPDTIFKALNRFVFSSRIFQSVLCEAMLLVCGLLRAQGQFIVNICDGLDSRFPVKRRQSDAVLVSVVAA